MSNTSSVLVGTLGRTVWLKVNGRGTFQNSPGVKEVVRQMVQRGVRDFVVDLGACELMDSTFMGTLAAVALRLRDIGQGGLRTVNVNPRNASLLENLGLDQLFAVEAGSLSESVPVLTKTPMPSPTDQKENVLEAHEALIQASSENEVKFRDVVEYLRLEMAQDAPKED